MDHIKEPENVQAHQILIVDDDQHACELLESLFHTKGYATNIVKSGQEAIQFVAVNEPDVVVLSVIMLEMDGWEIFTKIREDSDIPVLFLAPLTSGHFASLALHLSHTDYIHKPYSSEEILARIDNLLNYSRSKRRNLNLVKGEAILKQDVAITVVIPAYNESRFIGSTVLKACEYADSVIVVDDGSSDNTAEIAEEAGAVLVRHACNMGKAAALNTGFYKAQQMGAQIVVTLDADGQHLPEELSQIVKPVMEGKADIVIGSRYLEPRSEVPRNRIWGHWFFNRLTHLASGANCTDSQSGYRAFSSAALESIIFSSRGFSVESEMQFIAHEKGLRLLEVPITIRYTDRPKRSVISQGLSVLGGVFKLTGQYRPLFYFGLPGLICMLGGVILGIRVITSYEEIHELALGHALGCLLLSILGSVLFSMGFSLHSIRGLLKDMLRSYPKNHG